jgi:hypothetical protein
VRALVTAFFLGAAAVAALAVVIALTAAILAEASGRPALHVGLLGVELVSFERSSAGSATTFGPALAVLPLVGGLANAAGAAVIGRAREGEP